MATRKVSGNIGLFPSRHGDRNPVGTEHKMKLGPVTGFTVLQR